MGGTGNEFCESHASLVYIERSRTARAMQRDLVSTTTRREGGKERKREEERERERGNQRKRENFVFPTLQGSHTVGDIWNHQRETSWGTRDNFCSGFESLLLQAL